jgi:shikimate dehydrogenase
LNKTSKYGLIGNPIRHSLSPALFRAGFGGLYDYDLIEGKDFEKSYETFLNEYEAINVTAPFKEKAYSKAEIVSPECKVIGACNVLKKTKDGILAANTDYLGIMKTLLPYHNTEKIKPITMVVGCGGAGKAAAYAARILGNDVIILNRDINKAEDFAQKLLDNVSGISTVTAASLSDFCRYFRLAGTIIYTLPLAIPQLKELKRTDIQGGLFKKLPKDILEANYLNPSFSTERLSELQTINPKIKYASGTEWLVYQAVEAYEIFTGEVPNIQKMMNVI